MSDEMEEYRKQLNELVVWCVDTRDIVPPTAQQMRYERVVRLCEKLIATLASKPQVTEGEIAAEVLKSWEAQKDKLSPLTRWLAEDAARALLQQFEIRRK